MTRGEALDLLRFGAVAERLEAAVVLRSSGEPGDAIRVRRAMLRELNERVRNELMKTRVVLEQGASGSDAGDSVEDELSQAETRADAYARAVQDTTFEIVHEIRRLIGFTRGSALAEISDFQRSQTRADFDRLSDLLDAVERLGEVASLPFSEEFDLGGQIHDLAARVLLDHLQEDVDDGAQMTIQADGDVHPYRVSIELLGPQPLIVNGDKGLVELVVRNGLLNAVEASLDGESGHDGPPVVLINWGTTDVDTWVTINDAGLGLSAGLADPFQFARSTKVAHLGVGLTITRRAVRSMSGRVVLEKRPEGGASFRVRWPHERAES